MLIKINQKIISIKNKIINQNNSKRAPLKEHVMIIANINTTHPALMHDVLYLDFERRQT